MATRAITTATTSSAAAHLGSLIRRRAPAAVASGCGAARGYCATGSWPDVSAKRPVLNSHAQDHKPAKPHRRERARDRRPDDCGDADDLAHHRKVIRM